MGFDSFIGDSSNKPFVDHLNLNCWEFDFETTAEKLKKLIQKLISNTRFVTVIYLIRPIFESK